MICVIIHTWRQEPDLPFIMIKGLITIWMTVFNDGVVAFKARLAEMWGVVD